MSSAASAKRLPASAPDTKSRGERDEVVAGELAHLPGEADAAIGEQDFGLADAAGIENNLAGAG